MTEQAIVVSSRVRLARNLSGYAFPHVLDLKQANEIKAQVAGALDKQSYNYMDIASLPNIDRTLLVERHLISPDLLKTPEKSAVLLKKDETVSLMLNEEDHIRLQCMLDGFQMEKALEMANGIETELAEKLTLAYDKQWGYITACPTNIGTGLRASVMLHLPVLKMTNALGGVFSALSKVGLTVRGIYGEGTEALGDMYQLSNRITLGQTDAALLNNVQRAAQKLIDSEMQARETVLKKQPVTVEDGVYRAYAALKYARLLSANEFMQLISQVKLGISLGLLKDKGERTADRLLLNVQPAGVMKQMNEEASPAQRDIARARLVREAMSDITE